MRRVHDASGANVWVHIFGDAAPRPAHQNTVKANVSADAAWFHGPVCVSEFRWVLRTNQMDLPGTAWHPPDPLTVSQ